MPKGASTDIRPGARIGFARKHQRQLTALSAHQVKHLYARVNGDHVGRYVVRLGDARALELFRKLVKMILVALSTRSCGEQVPQSCSVDLRNDNGNDFASPPPSTAASKAADRLSGEARCLILCSHVGLAVRFEQFELLFHYDSIQSKYGPVAALGGAESQPGCEGKGERECSTEYSCPWTGRLPHCVHLNMLDTGSSTPPATCHIVVLNVQAPLPPSRYVYALDDQ